MLLSALLLLTWGLPCRIVALSQKQKLTHAEYRNPKYFGYNRMEEFTDKQLAQYRHALQSLRTELVELLQKSAASADAVLLDQSKVGRLSRVDAIQQQEMARASLVSYQRRLARVDQALAALNEGDYGYCQTCGKIIDPRRLEIRPESLLCVDCQRAAE